MNFKINNLKKGWDRMKDLFSKNLNNKNVVAMRPVCPACSDSCEDDCGKGCSGLCDKKCTDTCDRSCHDTCGTLVMF